MTGTPDSLGLHRFILGLKLKVMANRVSHVENLVGDFGGAPEVPGDDGAVSGVPARSVRAAQKLGAFLEEEDVQGLLDGRLVASHHLQKQAPVMLVSPAAQGTCPQSARGQAGSVRAARGEVLQAEQPRSWGLIQGDLETLLLHQANVCLPQDLPHDIPRSLA